MVNAVSWITMPVPRALEAVHKDLFMAPIIPKQVHIDFFMALIILKPVHIDFFSVTIHFFMAPINLKPLTINFFAVTIILKAMTKVFFVAPKVLKVVPKVIIPVLLNLNIVTKNPTLTSPLEKLGKIQADPAGAKIDGIHSSVKQCLSTIISLLQVKHFDTVVFGVNHAIIPHPGGLVQLVFHLVERERV